MGSPEILRTGSLGFLASAWRRVNRRFPEYHS
jgi:hypothetical protein